MTSTGVIAMWGDEGWGVVESPDTPGGCWVHVGHLWAITLPPTRRNESVHISRTGVPDPIAGETVDFEWERVRQDGYDYRAVSVRPRRSGPTTTIRWEYGSDRHPGVVFRTVARPESLEADG